MTDWTQPEETTHSVEYAGECSECGEPDAGNECHGCHLNYCNEHAQPDEHNCDSAVPDLDLDKLQSYAEHALRSRWDFMCFELLWSPATALRVLAELRAARDAAADAVEEGRA
jgi:hypothetical protein